MDNSEALKKLNERKTDLEKLLKEVEDSSLVEEDSWRTNVEVGDEAVEDLGRLSKAEQINSLTQKIAKVNHAIGHIKENEDNEEVKKALLEADLMD